MDNYTWDLTIKQNPGQPNKYIDSTVKVESAKLSSEELNIKQLSINNSHMASPSNGETRPTKDQVTVQVAGDKVESKTKVCWF